MMKRSMFALAGVAVLAVVTALVFGMLAEGGGKVQATHTVTITAVANDDPAADPGVPTPVGGCPLTNGAFTISLAGANVGPCGDGNNELTAWTFDFTTDPNYLLCFGGVLTSAKLTLTLTPLGVIPATDTAGIAGLGSIPGFPQTFPFGVTSSNFPPLELIPAPYSGAAILGVYTVNGGTIPMGYQDDAIVSFARLELTCKVAHAVPGPVGGIVGLLGNADTPADASGSSAGDYIAPVAAAAAAAVIALAAGGWYARRRWLN